MAAARAPRVPRALASRVVGTRARARGRATRRDTSRRVVRSPASAHRAEDARAGVAIVRPPRSGAPPHGVRVSVDKDVWVYSVKAITMCFILKTHTRALDARNTRITESRSSSAHDVDRTRRDGVSRRAARGDDGDRCVVVVCGEGSIARGGRATPRRVGDDDGDGGRRRGDVRGRARATVGARARERRRATRWRCVRVHRASAAGVSLHRGGELEVRVVDGGARDVGRRGRGDANGDDARWGG